jgi:hypothetical protein
VAWPAVRRNVWRAVAVLLILAAGSFAVAQSPRHLVCTLAQETGQRQDWVEQSAAMWMERGSDGRTAKFTVTDRKSTLHGVSGETLIDPGRSKVFIPDVSVTGPYAKMLYFIDLSGDTGEWQVLGSFTEKP